MSRSVCFCVGLVFINYFKILILKCAMLNRTWKISAGINNSVKCTQLVVSSRMHYPPYFMFEALRF
jgi:hypothetical protein